MNAQPPLLSTRLVPPRAPGKSIPRERLLSRLCDNMQDEGRLMVVSGPAGYGKSILLTQCLAAYDEAGWTTGWLNLDQSVNDETQFGRYFAELLRTMGCETPHADDRQLDFAPGFLSAANFVLQLAHTACAGGGRYLIVLEDFHAISDSAVQGILRELIYHLPTNLNLAISSRHSIPIPLAKFRSSGSLVEVGPDDLRLDLDESISFFRNFNMLDIDDDVIHEIFDSTGGWAAVMQLAAISIRAGEKDKRPTQWNVRKDQSVSEFFAQEVLDLLPADIVDFLLCIAISDRTCEALASAVTEGAPLSRDLDGLSNRLQLLQQLDPYGTWYRIHPVFREYLLRKLDKEQPQSRQSLHQKACTWFEEQGLIGEATGHAIEAGNLEHARELLEERGIQLINQGHLSLFSNLVSNLPDALLADSVEALLQSGWAEVLQNHTAQARKIINQIRDIVQGREGFEEADWLRLVELENAVNFFEDRLEDSEELLQEWAPKAAESGRETASFQITYAQIYLNQNNFDAALEQCRIIGNRNDLEDISLSYSYSVCTSALALMQRGLPRQAMNQLREILGWLEEHVGDASDSIAMVQSIMDALDYLTGSLPTGVGQPTSARVAKILSFATPDNLLALVPAWTRRIHTEEGDQHAVDFLLELKILAEERDQPRLTAKVLHERVRLYIAIGQAEHAQVAAQRAREQLRGLDRNPGFLARQSREWLQLSEARIALARGEYSHAETICSHLLEACLEDGRVMQAIELHVFTARILLESGSSEEAAQALLKALALDTENSVASPFRDEGELVREALSSLRKGPAGETYEAQLDAILEETPGNVEQADAVSDRRPSAADDSTASSFVESLTRKELATMEKLVEGLSNKEISELLCVSVHTVKSHLYSAYGKLGVSRRTQAVRRLKELGIFS